MKRSLCEIKLHHLYTVILAKPQIHLQLDKDNSQRQNDKNEYNSKIKLE